MEANYFTILYWFCHASTWIRHGSTRVPHPEPPSHLPPHTIPLGTVLLKQSQVVLRPEGWGGRAPPWGDAEQSSCSCTHLGPSFKGSRLPQLYLSDIPWYQKRYCVLEMQRWMRWSCLQGFSHKLSQWPAWLSVRTELGTEHRGGIEGDSVSGISKDFEQESTPKLNVTRGMRISQVCKRLEKAFTVSAKEHR